MYTMYTPDTLDTYLQQPHVVSDTVTDYGTYGMYGAYGTYTQPSVVPTTVVGDYGVYGAYGMGMQPDIMSTYGTYGMYGVYGEPTPVISPEPEPVAIKPVTPVKPVRKLSLKQRIANIVGRATSFDAAVRNIKELIQYDQDKAKIIPPIIDSLAQKYTPTLLESQVLKELKLTPSQTQQLYKIKAALSLELPQARQWLREYSEYHPELLGEYFALALRINAVTEALELLRTGLNFTQLPRLTVRQPAATPEQLLGLKYLTVTPV